MSNPIRQGPLTLRQGDLAFYDSFSGCIPAKVLEISGISGPASTAQTIRIRLTSAKWARYGYRRGEMIETNGLHVCPRRALGASGWIRFYTVDCQ